MGKMALSNGPRSPLHSTIFFNCACIVYVVFKSLSFWNWSFDFCPNADAEGQSLLYVHDFRILMTEGKRVKLGMFDMKILNCNSSRRGSAGA
jgi:hypothetical protein